MESGIVSYLIVISVRFITAVLIIAVPIIIILNIVILIIVILIIVILADIIRSTKSTIPISISRIRSMRMSLFSRIFYTSIQWIISEMSNLRCSIFFLMQTTYRIPIFISAQ